MKIRVILNNFQQTSHADITFQEGLTIIKGTNNQGKSSLMRALEAVIFNNPRKTKGYIKNGEKFCSVTIEVEGYKPITWKKAKDEVTYIIGDKTRRKAGRLCLKDVYPEHPFTLYDDTLLFNVIKQKAKPYPFNLPSSQVFNLFEDLYGILSTKEDMSKFTNRIGVFNTQITQNLRQLNTIQEKQNLIKEYTDTVSLEKLKKLRDKLQKAQKDLNTCSKIQGMKQLVDSYSVTPIPVAIVDLEATIQEMRKIKKLKNYKSVIDSKVTLTPPVKPETFEELRKYQVLKTYTSQLENLSSQRSALQKKILELRGMLPVCPTCKRPF